MLVRMRDLPIWQDRSRSLFDAVDKEMVEEGASLVLCIFSATDFNTASPAEPHRHPPRGRNTDDGDGAGGVDDLSPPAFDGRLAFPPNSDYCRAGTAFR